MGLEFDVTRNILVCGSSWRKESTEEGDPPSWGGTVLRVSWSPTPSHWLFSLRFLIYKRSFWHRTSFSSSLLFHQLQNLLWTISHSSPSIWVLATTRLSSQVNFSLDSNVIIVSKFPFKLLKMILNSNHIFYLQMSNLRVLLIVAYRLNLLKFRVNLLCSLITSSTFFFHWAV